MNYYYSGKITATDTYALTDLGFTAKRVIIKADMENAQDLHFSFNGSDLAGELELGEPITLAGINLRRIWIKGNGGNAEYRMWAWRK